MAKACLHNIIVHKVHRHPYDPGMSEKLLIIEKYYDPSKNGPLPPHHKFHYLCEGEDIIHIIEPNDATPQIHVAIDMDMAQELLNNTPLVCDESWKPKCMEEIDTRVIVAIVAFNFYPEENVKYKELCDTHCKIIRNATHHHPEIKHSFPSTGALHGMSGSRINQGSQKLGQYVLNKNLNLPQNEDHDVEMDDNVTEDQHMQLYDIEVCSHLIALIHGITHGVTNTHFAGVSYIAVLHKDLKDLMHTAGFTIQKNYSVLKGTKGQSSFYIANYGLLIHTNPPCITIWASGINYHTMTYTKVNLDAGDTVHLMYQMPAITVQS
ncbi:hypothetical protein BDQ17DRAFT_1430711 [Cyathus striatus]|nr:hypothetical protein BDQ17DRAFT_1430711 [Cyathus striatus]